MVKQGRQVAALAVAAAIVVGGENVAPAAAAPVIYEFGGTISNAGLFDGSSNPAWAFADGKAFRGRLVYDAAQVAYSYDYIDRPDFRLTYHSSPLVSLSYEIETNAGLFSYAPPAAGSGASIGVADGSGAGWTGADLRWHNYPVAGQPSLAVRADGYVGSWYAHASFLTLTDYRSRPLTDTGADVDLVRLFDALPSSSYGFAVRFSDPASWTPGGEHLDGIVAGQITRFARVGAAVPEPSSWALMLAGFAMVGYGLRRRRPMVRVARA